MAIAEFPVELILNIASYHSFEDSTLTHLALTCRHLYSVLIPGILEHQLQCMRHFPQSGLILSSYDKDDDAGWPKSFGGSYRMIQYHPGDSDEKKEILYLQSIICRAKHLDAVHIYLGERRTTFRILAAAISACARPDLSLTISGTIEHYRVYEFEGTNHSGPFTFEVLDTAGIPKNRGRKKYVNRLLSFLEREPFFKARRSPGAHNPASQINAGSRVMLAVPCKPSVELSLAPQSQLSSLFIASNHLFNPSLYPFTKNLLNTAKLTKLSLSQIHLNIFAWAEILPALTIPTLRELYVGKVSIAFPDLLTFLGRRCHQSIEVLDFTRNVLIGVVRISPLSIISQLTSLTASAEYLIPFLQSRNEGNLPALQHLGISALRAPLDHNENALNPAYELILNGRPFTSIKVDNIANSGMIEWIVKTSEQWPAENPFIELESLNFNDTLSIPHGLWDVLVTWVAEKILNEDRTRPIFNSRMFAKSNPKEALELFIWYIFSNLRYLNTTERASGGTVI